MTKIKKRAEKRIPSTNSMKAIEAAIPEMAPDDQNMQSWYQSYSSNHAARLAFDLDYVRSLREIIIAFLNVDQFPRFLLKPFMLMGIQL